ncbi:hypothetical protein [Pseudomonas ogarae]|uniref:hypothetical protein n=1 Tax=Pseudomonas ogarae (strain DSM 112162 / CECT 30235 / F113) TaxID=1114970 RepID=UPI00111716EA|nr:hypothetical protein [Pseudomonas ogarae]
MRAAPFARRPLHLALVSVLTLFSGIAVAVDATGNETADQPGKDKKEAALDTVTVTAERRTTDIQKTAVAVSAVGESQLQERQVHTLADLAGQAHMREVALHSTLNRFAALLRSPSMIRLILHTRRSTTMHHACAGKTSMTRTHR